MCSHAYVRVCLWTQSSMHISYIHDPLNYSTWYQLLHGAKRRTKSMFSTNWALHKKQIPRNIDFHVRSAKEMVNSTIYKTFPRTARETWIVTSIYTAIKGLGISRLFFNWIPHTRFVDISHLYSAALSNQTSVCEHHSSISYISHSVPPARLTWSGLSQPSPNPSRHPFANFWGTA